MKGLTCIWWKIVQANTWTAKNPSIYIPKNNQSSTLSTSNDLQIHHEWHDNSIFCFFFLIFRIQNVKMSNRPNLTRCFFRTRTRETLCEKKKRTFFWSFVILLALISNYRELLFRNFLFILWISYTFHTYSKNKFKFFNVQSRRTV